MMMFRLLLFHWKEEYGDLACNQGKTPQIYQYKRNLLKKKKKGGSPFLMFCDPIILIIMYQLRSMGDDSCAL